MEKKLQNLFIGLIVLLLHSPFIISNTQLRTGKIIGRFTYEGVGIGGVSVTLYGPSPSMMELKSVATDFDGIYRFSDLPPGKYTIKMVWEGFKTQTIEDIIVPVGKEVIINIKPEYFITRYKNQIDVEIKQLKIGKIMFNPPEEMTEHVKERIEVRISQKVKEDLVQGLKGSGIPMVEEIEVSAVMSAILYGDTFETKPLSDKEQIVLSTGYTQWEWDVTPLKAGQRKLQLSVSASINIDGYGEKKKSLPVMEKEIHVSVNPNIKKPRNIDWYKVISVIVAIVGAMAALFGIYFGFKQLKLAREKRKRE